MSFESQIPLGSFGDPVDIAEVASFLASTRYIIPISNFVSLNCNLRSKYITGASLDVNGGLF